MNDIDYSKICPRRGTAAMWSRWNPVLAFAEMGIEYPDTGIGTGEVKVKFGDGSTPWNNLEYGINPNIAHAIYGGTPSSSSDIFIRSGTRDEWLATDPVLGNGEIVYDKTNNSIIIGDGAHKYSELSYIKGSGLVLDDLDIDFGDEDADNE